MNEKEVIFPLIDFLPHQVEPWDKCINDDIKRAILIWHRRAGKDVFCFNVIVEKAIEKTGLYWYIFPSAVQARKSFWEAFIEVNGMQIRYPDLIPTEVIAKRSESEMKIELINGSIIRILGADNPDSLRGANPNGVVISEYSQQKPSLWDSIIEPILIRNDGWCIFNSTPLGENHCYDMYNYLKNSKNPKHFADLKTIRDTGIITEEQIKEIREQGRLEELIQQEYYCSFSSAMAGSYYNDILLAIEETNFKENIVYDGQGLVQTMWDLGISDSMAIWFVIPRQNEVQVLDYYEANGYGLGHYVDIINSKPYHYSQHNLPHDGGHRTLSMTEKSSTVQNQLMQLGLNNVVVWDRTNDVYADIQSVRGILPKCIFDKTKCKLGLDALKNYRKDFSEAKRCYGDRPPLHDWTSHASDAFRILPKIYNKITFQNNFINKKRVVKVWSGQY